MLELAVDLLPYALVALALTVGLIAYVVFTRPDESEWHPHPGWRGTMRRRIGSTWQYRDMTPEELKQDQSERAW
jgi:hypothetical protein